MAASIHVPRINNNDDEVKLVELRVAVGDAVEPGQVVASVETDKAVLDVEASAGGFVLAVQGELDSMVRVGSVLLWLGATVDEAVPADPSAVPAGQSGDASSAPTAKALALLREFGLAAQDVKASGPRLSADDVRRHAASLGLLPTGGAATGTTAPLAAPNAGHPGPEVDGTVRALSRHERGMLHTVSWQRDVAVPGYIELACDHAAWEAHAAAFGQQHKLLLSPLLPLMAWRLVELAVQTPRFNATLVGEQRHEYGPVNLGFTVQAGEVLYLAVVRDAAPLGEAAFVSHLVDVQRRSAAHALTPQELQGATIGFSSMSRWKVLRHVPILAPNTALMVAHTVDPDGRGVLGATYDHRVLHGGDVATLLRKLATPPKPRA